MGLSLTTPPHQREGAVRSPWRRLLLVASLVRYRFFLYAGLLPYLLGAAWAYAMAGAFDAAVFWSGLGGVVLAVVGVESFNEYFDAQMGTDRVFNPDDLPPMSAWVLWLGISAFAGALAVGVFLTVRVGWPILGFAVLGGLAAIFYVAPPIRWAYRGLGETVIALSYGPWMVLGSLYLHARAVSWEALWASRHLPAPSRLAFISRFGRAGRSWASRCSADSPPFFTWRRRYVGPTAAWVKP